MSNSTGTIHSVLSLGDVLSEIFSYSTQADNTSNARVCKVWCGHALNEIWHSATIVGLIALLSPVVKRRDATIMVRMSSVLHEGHLVHENSPEILSGNPCRQLETFRRVCMAGSLPMLYPHHIQV